MRRLLLALLLVPALLLPVAGPAAADDLFEIDQRLQDAGFSEAYTEAYESGSGGGYRVSVDYVSASSSRRQYEQEAKDVAAVLWEHLEGRVLALDVVPTHEVPWAPDGLPPAVTFVRGDLQTAFGPRPQGLDDGDVYGEEEDEFALEGAELGVGLGLVALVALGLLLAVVAAVVAVVVVVRRRQARQPAWGAWPPPGAWPGAGPQPGWQPPGGWPGAAAPQPGDGAPDQQAPPPGPDPGDPWAVPSGR